LVWKGKKPNRTEYGRFEPVFGSVRFGSKTWKKIISVWLIILVQNRTEPEMLTPSNCYIHRLTTALLGMPLSLSLWNQYVLFLFINFFGLGPARINQGRHHLYDGIQQNCKPGLNLERAKCLTIFFILF